MSERLVCSSISLGTGAFRVTATAWSLVHAMGLIARKTLAAVEALVAGVMCLLSAMAACIAVGGSLGSPVLIGLAAHFCLACVLCFSCLMLTVKFLFDGGQGLLDNSHGWWCGVALGVGLVFAGFASTLLAGLEVSTAEFFQMFEVFVLGTPLLIPAVHLFIEALVARRARNEA
jgi:hypothetical protein